MRALLILLFYLSGFIASTADAALELTHYSPTMLGCATELALLATLGDSSSGGQSRFPLTKTHALEMFMIQPFSMKQIQYQGMTLSMPLSQTLELRISYSRLDVLCYEEQMCEVEVGVGISGLSFQPALEIVTIDACNILDDYSIIFNLGISTLVKDGLKLGASATNVFSGSLSKSNQVLPTTVRIGLGSAITKNAGFGLEIEKQAGFDASVKSGIEWWTGRHLALRAGVCNFPTEYCMGLSVVTERLWFTICAVVNPALGVTRGGSITIKW